MQISRLFEIVYLLLEHKNMTANALATHFEVSKRTILRDVETLSMAGIPIFTTRGRGGGISILEQFVLNKTTLSDADQTQIIMALQSFAATQTTQTAAVSAKLSALFAKSDTAWIEVDFSRFGASAQDKEKFEQLKQAVLNRQALSFIYTSSYGEISTRTVYPLKLLFRSKSWYLQAYCIAKQDYRTFKINRMLQITLLNEYFTDKTFTMPVSKAQTSNNLIDLVLLCSSDAAFRIYDEFQPDCIIKNSNGTFTVKTCLPNDNWLYSFLLSMGTLVRVIKPAHVKKQLRLNISKMQDFYKDDI